VLFRAAPGARQDYGTRVEPLPFFTRLWFAWVCFFRVLFDGLFAAKVYHAPSGQLEAGPTKPEALPPAPTRKEPEPKSGEPNFDPALQLLALLQREGRLVDFLEEDVASFSDADIGAAARVVHSGCRKALREHVTLKPVRGEEEGARVTLKEGAQDGVKLTGNVAGKGPHTGTLRHRGWRATDVKLPTAVAGHDAHIVAEAEVEL
jgi:hypothetical protein